MSQSTEIRAALADLDRVAARLRRVLVGVEADEQTRRYLLRQADREPEADVVAFDACAGGGR